MSSKRVLMVLTSHEDMGASGKKTGNWFDEVATPYYTFKAAGFDVTLASPQGGAVPLDPLSASDAFATESTRRFAEDAAAQRALAQTTRFDQIDLNGFDAAFFPGGYGQLWDLASDSKVIHAIESWIRHGTPVAMVCHGVAILRDVRKQDGEPLVNGIALTGFTDAEDEELGLTRHLLFSLEKAMVQNGAHFRRSERNWQPNVVEDGALITGQNPASAATVADALVARLIPVADVLAMQG
jgi:putative intracellular protease/amidase